MDKAEVDRLILKPTARRRLGKYVLLGRLGHGGMGKIYLAYLPGPAGIEKLLVVKRLHSHLTNDRVLVASFLDEARLSMALSHPNIVHTYDVGEMEGRYFMVMEHIDGQNLGVLLRTAKRSGQYPDSNVWAGLFLSVLDGLHAAHVARDARGRPLNIIHRDVSPQNILVTYEGVPKLVDFGIAKAAMRINETDAGVLKGKYAYMSPEQCESADLDTRSDVFSAGIVLWEMLAGRRLYKSDSILRSVERILKEPPISPLKVNAECDPNLAPVVLKALQKKREDRFTSAEDFRDAIDEVMRKSERRYRKNDVRDLMQGIFSDVIERQRAILDRCLANEDPIADDDDGSSRSDVHAHEPDSQSDLNVPHIGVSNGDGHTTPSAFRLSPLVTRDGDGEGTPETARRRAVVPIAQGDATPDAVTSAHLKNSGPQRRQKRQSGVPLALGLGIVLLLLLLSGFYATGTLDGVLGIRSESVVAENLAPLGDSASSNGTKNTNRVAEDRDTPGDGKGVPATGVGPSGVGPSGEATTEDGATSNPEKPSGTSSGAGDVDVDGRNTGRDDVNEKKKERPSNQRRTGRASDGERRDAAKPSSTKPETKPTVVEEPRREESRRDEPRREEPRRDDDRPPQKAVEETGFLTLDTVPWTTVSLNGKVLGNTPLLGVKVPAGELTLSLKNSSESIAMEYSVDIRPGQTTKKRLGLR